MKVDYDELTESFENMKINANTFRHVDHIGVAYTMMKKYDFLTVVYDYAWKLNTIATRAGAADKFHTTITVAFLSIIAERMETTQHRDANDFLDCNQDLITQNPLKELYSAERLSSDEARRTFLLPDQAA